MSHHPLSELLVDYLDRALSQHSKWIAYNAAAYLLDRADVALFDHKPDALRYCLEHTGEINRYDLIYASSIRDVFHQLRYGDHLYNIISPNNSPTMNDKNLDYLSKQLQYTGFGESLHEKLKEQLQKGDKEFALPFIPEFAKENSAVTLQFKKSETQDNYFFNRYSVHVKTPDYPDAIKQTFYLNQGQDNITLKEAYNLLHGRAVHKEMTPKEGEKYMAWVQLDFKNTEPNGNYKVKQFHQNYGFDLDATLLQKSIKELHIPEQRERLIASLERGNRQLVTFAENGKEVKAFIEAAPQFKSLNYYNEQHKRVDLLTINKGLAPEGAQKEKGQQQSVAPNEEEGSSKKKRSKKQSM